MFGRNPPQILSPSRRDALHYGLFALAGVGTKIVIANDTGTATPSEIEGPYWVDEMLNRSDIRSDPGTGVVEDGLELRLMVSVSRLASGKATPVQGAYVDLWHCNAEGAYSDEPAGMGNPNTQGQKFCRGYQVTDGHGSARFKTIYPGWYNGRTVHIHARVRTFANNVATTNFTTQFFFDDELSDVVYAAYADIYGNPTTRDTDNENDNVYNTVSAGSTQASPDGDRLQLRMADDGTHVIASYNIVLI